MESISHFMMNLFSVLRSFKIIIIKVNLTFNYFEIHELPYTREYGKNYRDWK